MVYFKNFLKMFKCALNIDSRQNTFKVNSQFMLDIIINYYFLLFKVDGSKKFVGKNALENYRE